MNRKTRWLVATWILGSIFGTFAIAVTSPLFVRSYIPLQLDSARGVWTYADGYHYRWRSEGYATTRIGDHGMPGRAQLPPESPARLRVAIWGDSQAEGVCVADHQKLFAQADQIARQTRRPFDFIPLAKSGQDAADWLTQFPAVEQNLGVDVHVMLIVELSDLFSAADAPLQPPPADAMQNRSALAASLPAFAIQAVRYLVTDSNDSVRRLRFSVGPVPAVTAVPDAGEQDVDWTPVAKAIRATTQRPVMILYAPNSPHLMADEIAWKDPQAGQFERLKRAFVAEGMIVADMRPPFQRAASARQWPHGFQNGQIGNGHLNASGYQLIASELVGTLVDRNDDQD